MSSDSTPSDTTQSSASMLHGHATYVAGAAKETYGNLTSSEPWQSAGKNTKDAAIEEMRTAKEAAGGDTTQNATVGKIEKTLGGAVGCEGMAEEGAKAADK